MQYVPRKRVTNASDAETRRAARPRRSGARGELLDLGGVEETGGERRGRARRRRSAACWRRRRPARGAGTPARSSLRKRALMNPARNASPEPTVLTTVSRAAMLARNTRCLRPTWNRATQPCWVLMITLRAPMSQTMPVASTRSWSSWNSCPTRSSASRRLGSHEVRAAAHAAAQRLAGAVEHDEAAVLADALQHRGVEVLRHLARQRAGEDDEAGALGEVLDLVEQGRRLRPR